MIALALRAAPCPFDPVAHVARVALLDGHLLRAIASASAARTRPQLFAPADTRTLRSFGAAGDGRRDDTAALQRALDGSDLHCLDGEGASYRMVGTLRSSRNLCLRNATLRQDLPPFDTSALHLLGAAPPRRTSRPSLDCGDAVVAGDSLARLGAAIRCSDAVDSTGRRAPKAAGVSRPGDDRSRAQRPGRVTHRFSGHLARRSRTG